MRLVSTLLPALVVALCLADSPKAADTPAATIHGKLILRENQTPAIEGADHKLIVLKGDSSTEHVLRDKRLAGLDVEVTGRVIAPGILEVDAFYTHAVRVIKDGKHLIVTYWCDVCSIRQFEPGPCWCCQRETKLDLRDPDAQ